VHKLVKALQDCPSLKVVKVCVLINKNTWVGFENDCGCHAIQHTPHPSVQEFSFRNTSTRGDLLNSEPYEDLLKLVAMCPNLTNLDITGFDIDFDAFGLLFANLIRLETIQISWSDRGQLGQNCPNDGWKVLQKSLSAMESLEWFIFEDGGPRFCRGIKEIFQFKLSETTFPLKKLLTFPEEDVWWEREDSVVWHMSKGPLWS
jgi:hypothetical protein